MTDNEINVLHQICHNTKSRSGQHHVHVNDKLSFDETFKGEVEDDTCEDPGGEDGEESSHDLEAVPTDFGLWPTARDLESEY